MVGRGSEKWDGVGVGGLIQVEANLRASDSSPLEEKQMEV